MADRYCDGCNHPHELCICKNPDYDPALADGFPQADRGDLNEVPATIAEVWADQLEADDFELHALSLEDICADDDDLPVDEEEEDLSIPYHPDEYFPFNPR